jgi:hypothetical protein
LKHKKQKGGENTHKQEDSMTVMFIAHTMYRLEKRDLMGSQEERGEK